MSGPAEVIRRMKWHGHRATLGRWEFQVQDPDVIDWSKRDRQFMLYKEPGLLAQYAEFWDLRPAFRAKNVLEIGIWDGASTALLVEMFSPSKLVALDDSRRGDSTYFRSYLDSVGARGAVSTFWDVNQADTERLLEIVSSEFSGPLDLVVDDASHQYDDARASFEVLFPRLREGGLYIIEDWARAHLVPPTVDDDRLVRAASRHHVTEETYRRRKPLHTLAEELLALTGRTWVVASFCAKQGFCVVERGPIGSEHGAFRLDTILHVREFGAENTVRR